KLGLPDLIPTQMTLELVNCAICTPDGIARDVFVLVGKFTFLANFVVVDYESDPRCNTTYSANSLLKEFADELALISYPPDYDDYRACDIESDIREIEFLLFQGEDSDFKDSIDQSVLTHCDDLFVDPTPEMFADEQPPYYSFPSRFDVYPDDFLEIESDATVDDDSFDSEGEKIKDAELLIDPLDLPYFSRDDVLFSPDNEDK
nr:reverse transcriptase domain-containing protein [Tanacetum cinerariifolium]